MITLLRIDKSGGDIFEKDYSIVLTLNKGRVYGVNIPQKIKDSLVFNFKKGNLNINHTSNKKKKNRFRLRFHTCIIIKLIEKVIYDLGAIDDIAIEICNDFDGHFHEIKDMVFKHIIKLIPNLNKEDIVSTKFQKPSLIDNAGKAFRERDKGKLKNYTTVNLSLEELYKIIKKWTERYPLNMEECIYCPAIGICGGGCPFNAETRMKDLYKLDKPFCVHTNKILKWLLKESVSEKTKEKDLFMRNISFMFIDKKFPKSLN